MVGAASVGLFTTGVFENDVADGPARTEAPLTVVPAATGTYEVVRDDSIGLRLADGQMLSFGIGAYAYFDTYTAHSCMTLDRGGWCNTGTSAPDRPVSVEPELGGTDTVVYWTGVPADADLVEFHSIAGVLWQHPVEGIAAFPAAAHAPTDELIAYDASGVELGRVSWAGTRMTGSSEATDELGQVWTRTYFTSLPDPVPPTVDVARVRGAERRGGVGGVRLRPHRHAVLPRRRRRCSLGVVHRLDRCGSERPPRRLTHV